MTGKYELKLGDRPVGNVEVSREGLYYHFHCLCQLAQDTLCRVFAGEVNLGVLIPQGELFHLETRIPVSRFKEGVPAFILQPNKPILTGRFIPIKPEEPFSYIARLKDAYLTYQDNQMGIVIQEKAGT